MNAAQPVLSSSSLTSNDVVNSDGSDLGNIKDLMIDTETGDVRYAVLSFGGFLGLGDKLFAVPWSAPVVDTAKERFVLDVDKDTLESAPGFDKDDWPDMASETWHREVHAAWNLPVPSA